MTPIYPLVLAGTVVVHDGVDPQHAARVAARTLQVPLSDVRTATIPELVGARRDGPLVTTRTEGCEGERRTNAEIAELLGEAEEQAMWVDYPRARLTLDQALVDVRCLQEPVNRTTLARAHYLRAVTGFQLEGAIVSEHFEAAVSLDPALTWDEQFKPEDGRERFDRVRDNKANAPRTPLVVLSGDTQAELRIDGGEAAGLTGALTPGEHLLQLQEQGTWLTLDITVQTRDPVVVLSPVAATDASISWIFNPETSDAAARALTLTLPRDDHLVALLGSRIAVLDPARPGWDVRTTVRTPPLLSRSLLAAGGLASGAGAIGLAATTRLKEDAVTSAAGARSWAEYREARSQHQSATTMGTVYAATLTTGAVALSSGVVLELVNRTLLLRTNAGSRP